MASSVPLQDHGRRKSHWAIAASFCPLTLAVVDAVNGVVIGGGPGLI